MSTRTYTKADTDTRGEPDVDTTKTWSCREDPGPLNAVVSWGILADHRHVDPSRCIPSLAARALLGGVVG